MPVVFGTEAFATNKGAAAFIRLFLDAWPVDTEVDPGVVSAWLGPLLLNHPRQDKLANWSGRVIIKRSSGYHCAYSLLDGDRLESISTNKCIGGSTA